MRKQHHCKCQTFLYRNIGVFEEYMSLHSDGNYMADNAKFPCLWQHYRDNLCIMNRFWAIYPMFWLETGSSLILSMNILLLHLFSSWTQKWSVDGGWKIQNPCSLFEFFYAFCYCTDNVAVPTQHQVFSKEIYWCCTEEHMVHHGQARTVVF